MAVQRSLVRASALPGERLRGRLTSAPGRWLVGLALLIAAVPVVIYLWLAAHRIGLPYELDWLEGGTVELVARAMHGHGLYSPPTLGYVGFTYTPLYSYVSAAVAEVTGIGFLPLRIVSLLSSFAVMGLLARYVRDVAGSWVAGAVAAAIFAACYQISGDSFDVGRLDSLFLALTLLTLWLGRRVGSVRGGIGLGVVAFLAFFTKQVALLAVVPALVVAVPFRPRPALAALITLVALAGASTLILDAGTDNWYRYYILSELTGQPEAKPKILGFWQLDLYRRFRELALLAALGLVAVAVSHRLRPAWRAWRALGLGAYDLAALLGLWVTAWISIVHSGGWLNVLMPAYAGVGAAGGVAFGALWRRGRLTGVLALGLVSWQLALLLPGAGVALPARTDGTAYRELIAALKRLPGPVLVLRHPWYGTVAGKGSFAQSDGIAEVLRSEGPRGATDLRRSLRGALNRYHIQAVVLDGPAPAWIAPQLAAEFRLVPGTITAVPLKPPRDIRSAPTYLYLRRTG